jgi:hypothetical protein
MEGVYPKRDNCNGIYPINPLINGVHSLGTYIGKEILGLVYRKYQNREALPNQIIYKTLEHKANGPVRLQPGGPKGPAKHNFLTTSINSAYHCVDNKPYLNSSRSIQS